jgi:hypothetical protein
MFELLIETLSNYFVSLVISIVFWKLVHRNSGRNFTEPVGKFWHIAQYFSMGLLWHNLLNAFMPNFVIFIPRKISKNELILFIFSILLILFTIVKKIARSSRKIPADAEQTDFRLPALFNVLYASTILLFAHFTTISIVTSWISLGLRRGMKIVHRAHGAELKFKFSMEKILKDIYIISIGVVAAIIFTKVVRV